MEGAVTALDVGIHERCDVVQHVNPAEQERGGQLPAPQHLPDGTHDQIVVGGRDGVAQAEDEADVEDVGGLGELLGEKGLVAEQKLEKYPTYGKKLAAGRISKSRVRQANSSSRPPI